MWIVDHNCLVQGHPHAYHLGNHKFHNYQDAKDFMDRQATNVTEAIRGINYIMGSRNRAESATAMDATGAQHTWEIERIPNLTMEGGG